MAAGSGDKGKMVVGRGTGGKLSSRKGRGKMVVGKHRSDAQQ